MKITAERKVVNLMIDLYYKKKYKGKLENEYLELKTYVNLRLNKCPFGDNKTFCSNCKIHCYNKEMQQKIKEVMRYSGPRMLMYHPVVAIKHLIESRKEKKKNGKK